jgi:hypothetical protein
MMCVVKTWGHTTRRLVALGVCSAALTLAPITRAAATACPSLPTLAAGESTNVPPPSADWALIVVNTGPTGATVDRFRYEAFFDHVTPAKAVGIGIGGDQGHFLYVAGLNQNEQDLALNLGGVRFERRLRLGDNSSYSASGTDTNQRVLQPCAHLAYLTFVPGAHLARVTTALTTSRGAAELITYSGRGGGAIRASSSTTRAVAVGGVFAGNFKVPFTASRGAVAGLAQNVHVVRGHWRSPSGGIYEIGRADPRFQGAQYLTGAAGRWTLAITTETLSNAPSLNPGLLGAWADVGPLRSLLGFYDAR